MTTRSKSPSAANVATTLTAIAKETVPVQAVVKMCVRGDLFAEHSRLDSELEQAIEDAIGDGSKLSDPAALKRKQRKEKLAKDVKALEAEMRDYEHEFVFQVVSKAKWSDLKGQHLPRDDNQLDQRYGVNYDSFMGPAVQASCVNPTGMDDDTVFGPWWDSLSDGQRDVLFLYGAWSANREQGTVPKSLHASSVTQPSRRNSGSASE